MPSFLILRHHHDWLAIYVFKTRVKARAKAEREGGVNGVMVMGHGPECRDMLVRQQSRDWSGCEVVCNIARVTWHLRRIFITSLANCNLEDAYSTLR